MAKDLNDIADDLDRGLSFALHCALDDAAEAKIDVRESEVVCLQGLSHTLCTLAYVLGMEKEGFLKALAATWDTTKRVADETAEQLIDLVKKTKEEETKPVTLPDVDNSLKN
jgi:hypothetical protein